MADVQLQAVITAKDEASAKMNKFASGLGGVVQSLGKMAAVGVAAGAAMAGVFIKKSIDAAKDEEVAMAKVDAILRTLTETTIKTEKVTSSFSKTVRITGTDEDNLKDKIQKVRAQIGLKQVAIQKLSKQLSAGKITQGEYNARVKDAQADIALLRNRIGSLDDGFSKTQKTTASFTKTIELQGISLESSRKAVEAASKAALQLGFDDEDAALAMAKLLQVTNDTEIAQKAMAVSMDLARFKGIELSEAQQALTLAMMGNTRVLKQLGIEVPDNATKQDVLRLAMAKVSGQAVAYGNTLAGAQAKAQVAFENLQEEVGKIFLPIMANMFSSISAFLTSDRLQIWLTNVRILFNDYVFPAMKKVGDFITNVLWPALHDNLAPAWRMAYEAIQPHLPLLKDVAKWIGIIAGGALVGALIIVSNVIAGIVVGLGKMISAIKEVINWFQKLSDKIKDFAKVQAGTASGALDKVLDFVLPGRAAGGSVRGGQPYMVGERGPELFIPSQSGSILPNHQMGAGSIVVNFNNPSVRNDSDLRTIVATVKRTLSNDLRMTRTGAL